MQAAAHAHRLPEARRAPGAPGGGAQGHALLSLRPTPPDGVLNYVSHHLPRPAPSGGGSGSGDWVRPDHTPAGLVTMEEIGILVEKAQVRWGLARGDGATLI